MTIHYYGTAPCGCERTPLHGLQEEACFCDDHDQDCAPWYVADAIVNGMRAIDSWPSPTAFFDGRLAYLSFNGKACVKPSWLITDDEARIFQEWAAGRFGDYIEQGESPDIVDDIRPLRNMWPGFPYTPPPKQPDTLPAPAPDEPDVQTPRLPTAPIAVPATTRVKCYWCGRHLAERRCLTWCPPQPPGGE